MRLRTAHKAAKRRRAAECFRASWAAFEAGRHKDWHIDWYVHTPPSPIPLDVARIVEDIRLQMGEPTRVWIDGKCVYDVNADWIPEYLEPIP